LKKHNNLLLFSDTKLLKFTRLVTELGLIIQKDLRIHISNSTNK